MTAQHPFGPESYAAYATIIAGGQGDRVDWLGLLETMPADDADAFARGVRDEVLRRPHALHAAGLAEVGRIWPLRSEQRRQAANEEAAAAAKDARQRFQWLREFWLRYAIEAAVAAFLGDDGFADDEDSLREGIVSQAARLKIPADVAKQMAVSILAEAGDTARRFHEALRRRIWPLCAAHAPGPQIIAAADGVHERFGGHLLARDTLLAECRRVATQASRRRQHVRC